MFRAILFMSLLTPIPSNAQGGAVQFDTRGLAVIDSPAPGSQMHAGSSLNLAIALDANGKLSPGTFTDSSLPIFYTSLNVFLVSSQTNLNLTVANSSILTNSQGTVAHVDFTTPQCVPPGAYNITLYEGSIINGKPYYTITPMSITIDNTQKSSDNSECQSNGVQNQPQQDSPPPQGTIPEVGGAGSGSQSVTYVENSSGLPSAMSVVQSASTTGPQTSQFSVPVTTLTIEVISATTLTDTLAGSTVVTTSFSTTTVTAVMATSDVAHFFPVNRAMPSARTSLTSGAIAAVLMTLLLL